jgi:hypothetical protein
MVRKLLILAGGIALACGSPALAGPVVNNFTELATYTAPSLGGSTVTINNAQNLNGSGGVTFINSYNGNPFVGPLPVPFKSVGAVPIANVTFSNTPAPGSTTQNATGSAVSSSGVLVGVFALQGQTNGLGANAVTFHQGVERFYLSNQAFSPTDLSTWGLPGTASAVNGGTLIGQYVLKNNSDAKSTILPDQGAGIPGEQSNKGNPLSTTSFANGLGPTAVNNSSVPANKASITGSAQFRDVGTVMGLGTNTPSFNQTGKDAFSNRTTDGTSIFPNTFLLPGQITDFTDAFQTTGTFPFSKADLTIANNFFKSAAAEGSITLPDGQVLPGANLLNDTFNGFATGVGSGPDTNFNDNLSFAGGTFTSTTGDFTSTTAFNEIIPTQEPTPFTTTSSSATHTIPEPASMLLWGLIAGGGGLYGALRRRRRKARA